MICRHLPRGRLDILDPEPSIGRITKSILLRLLWRSLPYNRVTDPRRTNTLPSQWTPKDVAARGSVRLAMVLNVAFPGDRSTVGRVMSWLKFSRPVIIEFKTKGIYLQPRSRRFADTVGLRSRGLTDIL